jgi:prepilin-type processing-associated H-X9-DG protein
LPNATVVIMQATFFLCPSDPYKGSTTPDQIRNIMGLQNLAGATNYPANIGMNRRINGGQVDANWQFNGPNNILSTWDGIGRRFITMQSFTDGTSSTAMYSEWVKGPGEGPPRPDNLGMVYYLPNQAQTNAFPTDLQFAQACAQAAIKGSNQAHGWKGEWWVWGASTVYSHTNLPNRYCCAYQDQNVDSRGTITLQNASSLHPGGVNVLFMDGSVRFIKSSVNWQPWYAIATPDGNEALAADQL